ncbi:MAG: bifunctional precorrin-2 dehydrogenase/sirohydrochlorin ferrochelatase [Proteobacteria bacterium]|nr:bifunctional precorrin-2 dehydrogenase/sirohydrochlorin ferrochelatase [Pseudomonadota bacterium]MBU1639789.1 bifunctional precorrin-2 dehydrogenase/sirohydrochlorin ferrochelatase [Pseudomonadota bacterium]
MSYFPINVDIRNRPCTVIGGGRVALRKVKGLLECGADVTLISPEATSELEMMAVQGRITWYARGYKPGDLAGSFLVIAATDDEAVQEQVHAEAQAGNLLLNVADVPKWCNFILPATVRQGDLTISISTAGKSPALAKRLRQELEKSFGPEYNLALELMGSLRPVVLAKGLPHAKNKIIFEELLHPELISLLTKGDWQTISSHLHAVLGADVDLSCLDTFRRNLHNNSEE